MAALSEKTRFWSTRVPGYKIRKTGFGFIGYIPRTQNLFSNASSILAPLLAAEIMMRVTCAPRLVAKTSRIAWLNTARIAHQKRVTCFNVNRLFSSVDITKPTDSENSQDSTSHRAIVSEDGIAGLVGYTPLVRLNRVAEKCKAKVYAKMEGMNPGGELKAAPATRTRPRINGLTSAWDGRQCQG